MNTMMARLWMLGAALGVVFGLLSGGGITAVAVFPLVGATAGILVAMMIDEVRGRLFRKKKH